VKRAYRTGMFSLAIAEALTLGSHEQQRAILESLQSPSPPDVDDIRNLLLGQKPTLSMAIFPRERYTGTITTDLFADDETSYFDDVDQFLTLQKEAAESLAEERRKTAAWVKVLYLYTVPWWQYREAAEGEASGVVINLHPSGEVEVREGLAKHEVEPEVAHTTRASPMAPRPPRERPAFTTELLRYAALQRSAAVQATLLADPRKAKEVGAVLLLLGLRRDFGVRLSPHACHRAGSEVGHIWARQVVAVFAADLAGRLGFNGDNGDGHDPEDGVGRLTDSPDGLIVYDAVRRLSDADLDGLLMLLLILCLGQNHVDAVDEGDSLFNRIALNSGVKVRHWWKPDAAFLSLLTREQMLGVATECGAAEHLPGINGWTKKRLVEELAIYFESHADPEGVPDDDRRACDWLPGLLRFPAVKSLGVTETP